MCGIAGIFDLREKRSVEANLIEQMTKMQQYTFVCAPTPFQKASLTAMDTDISDHVADYRKKRDMIYDGLKDSFELTKPGGGFYLFPKSPVADDVEFVRRAQHGDIAAFESALGAAAFIGHPLIRIGE